jgi:hypothetical protein
MVMAQSRMNDLFAIVPCISVTVAPRAFGICVCCLAGSEAMAYNQQRPATTRSLRLRVQIWGLIPGDVVNSPFNKFLYARRKARRSAVAQ